MNLKKYHIPFFSRPPRIWRPQWLPIWMGLQNEASLHPHVPEERASLFLAYGTASTEIEVLNWLYATVILLKPECVLETGTAGGLGTIALASACKANGFGSVHSVEYDPGFCHKASSRLRLRGLSRYASVHNDDSLHFLRNTALRFQLAFFDSRCDIRVDEYSICCEREILDGPAVFHDTSPTRTLSSAETPEPTHKEYRERLFATARQSGVSGFFESTLSRGLFVIFPEQPSESKTRKG